MKSLSMFNPVIVHPIQSIELDELKEQERINKLVRLNLKKIIKDRLNVNKKEIIVQNGKMYYYS